MCLDFDIMQPIVKLIAVCYNLNVNAEDRKLCF